MAQDEGRFGRLGQVMKAWCPSGHRPLVPKQGIRDYVYDGSSDRTTTGQNDNFGTSFCEYHHDGIVSTTGFYRFRRLFHPECRSIKLLGISPTN